MPPTSRDPLLFSLERDLKEKEDFERNRERLAEEEEMALQQLLIDYRRDNPEYSRRPRAGTGIRPEENLWLPKTPSPRNQQESGQTKRVKSTHQTKRVQPTHQSSSRFANQYSTTSQFASQYHMTSFPKPPAPGVAKQSKFPTPPSRTTHDDEMSLDWLE